MAINKKLIHFNNFSNFNSKKLSANVENTKYTIGIEGSILNGEPEILYQSIVYIKDVLQLWTHGLIYDCSETGFIPGEGEGSAVLNNGTDCSATGKNSIAGGRLAYATGEASVALGKGCEASGKGSIALGGYISGITLTGPANSLVYTTTDYIPLDLIGHSIYLIDSTFNTKVATITNVQGNSITVDKTLSLNTALNDKQFVILLCKATGMSAVALGMASKADGLASLAEGQGTVAIGGCSHAEGGLTIATGDYSHAEGKNSKALGAYSHAENSSLAVGLGSHSEGGIFANIYLTGNNKIYTIENGTNIQNSFFFVQKLINLDLIDPNSGNTIATIINTTIGEDGYTVTVELNLNLGQLKQQQFVVYGSIAEGHYSHSEGFGHAAGKGSHAGGWGAANGEYSFSHGDNSTATGKTSTVFGTNNYSQNNSEFALGRSNRSHNGETNADKTLFSVGCGSFEEISMETRIANKIPLPTPEDGTNALEIMQNGDIWLGTYNEGHKIWDNVNKRVCNAWSVLEYPSINVTLTTLGEPNLFSSYFNSNQTVGTFSAPYATIIPEGVTAYYSTTPYKGYLSFISIEKGLALPANLGVILVGEPGVNNVVFHPAYNSIKLADLSLNTILNTAQGPVTMIEGDCILSKGPLGIGIYNATPGGTLKAGKAYVHQIN